MNRIKIKEAAREIMQRIEAALSLRLAQHYHLDLKALFYDATNFDTYIDSQTAAELPQRGHAKSHRGLVVRKAHAGRDSIGWIRVERRHSEQRRIREVI